MHYIYDDAGQEPVVVQLQQFVDKYQCSDYDRQYIVSPLYFLKGVNSNAVISSMRYSGFITFNTVLSKDSKFWKEHDAHEVYLTLMHHLLDNTK